MAKTDLDRLDHSWSPLQNKNGNVQNAAKNAVTGTKIWSFPFRLQSLSTSILLFLICYLMSYFLGHAESGSADAGPGVSELWLGACASCPPCPLAAGCTSHPDVLAKRVGGKSDQAFPLPLCLPPQTMVDRGEVGVGDRSLGENGAGA